MAECKTGRIHSIETFGTVDGPGTRYVIFFQGCPFRCLYCHNPDTWTGQGGSLMTAEELLSGYEKNAVFYKNGGITASGGEPLLQLDFLTELFRKAKAKGIHTCLDTSGAVYQPSKRTEYETLLSYTDLVLLDIKHSDPAEHKRLTGHTNDAPLAFAALLSELMIPMVIRHVLVPEITDNTEQLTKLGILMKQFPNIVGLEVLPFHQMGTAKYENLGIPYPLKDVPALTKEDAKRARRVILEAYYYDN
ncbi:MAG: pyruvate formate lyase-activating protein [Lachnospiraceae bacterium]|nr:pyruvate formate lyase-activating protein [Lachnospiraceae bacterium]